MAKVYELKAYSVTGHAGPTMLADYAWARRELFARVD